MNLVKRIWSYERFGYMAEPFISQYNTGRDVIGRLSPAEYSAMRIKGHLLLLENNAGEELSFSMQKNKLQVDKVSFFCPEWGQYYTEQIECAVLYLLTVPEVHRNQNGDMKEQLIRYIHENAFLDGIREQIRRDALQQYELKKKGETLMVSPSYGPGFYGMPLEDMDKLYRLLEGEELDISIKNNMLKPMKSCGGIFFVLHKDRLGQTEVSERLSTSEQMVMSGQSGGKEAKDNACIFCRKGDVDCGMCARSI